MSELAKSWYNTHFCIIVKVFFQMSIVHPGESTFVLKIKVFIYLYIDIEIKILQMKKA